MINPTLLKTEQALNHYFNIIVDTNPDVIVHFSLERKILSINQAIKQLTGHSPGVFLNKSVEDFLCANKTVKQFHRKFNECCRTQHIVSMELDVREGMLGGHYFHLNFIPIPEEHDPKKLSGLFLVMRDITMEKELLQEKVQKIEEQQILSQRLINKANKLQNFSYIVSHNLRSPIASLTGLVDLYSHSGTEDEKKEIIEMIRKSVDHLNETVEDLSEMIKINQNLEIKLEEIEFESVVKRIEESVALRIQETNTSIIRDFRACKRFVYSKAYIESIILNLVTNAIKYRDPGRPPQIELTTWRRGSDIVLTCRDNGVGINLDVFGDKIFGLHKTFHGNKDARGVGLFITKTQIEALGGSISVESKVGQGTTFHIRFPQKID